MKILASVVCVVLTLSVAAETGLKRDVTYASPERCKLDVRRTVCRDVCQGAFATCAESEVKEVPRRTEFVGTRPSEMHTCLGFV